ncbi:hypothetical protein, partial [Kingella kingae]|uniref:hypothetical protein n=1 Tax=Kingella kingae TaxID=504 RepID=UPI001E42CEBF
TKPFAENDVSQTFENEVSGSLKDESTQKTRFNHPIFKQPEKWRNAMIMCLLNLPKPIHK